MTSITGCIDASQRLLHNEAKGLWPSTDSTFCQAVLQVCPHLGGEKLKLVGEHSLDNLQLVQCPLVKLNRRPVWNPDVTEGSLDGPCGSFLTRGLRDFGKGTLLEPLLSRCSATSGVWRGSLPIRHSGAVAPSSWSRRPTLLAATRSKVHDRGLPARRRTHATTHRSRRSESVSLSRRRIAEQRSRDVLRRNGDDVLAELSVVHNGQAALPVDRLRHADPSAARSCSLCGTARAHLAPTALRPLPRRRLSLLSLRLTEPH
mmetsp:Transcript_33782/g.73952  ORF Transcript_33782/g.73952 Transcript_33782/m.73952 type:complete len:260 (+) Transcript_33782:699-1478(+)